MEDVHGLTDMIAQKYKDFPDLVRYDVMMPWEWKAPPKWVDTNTGGDYGQVIESRKSTSQRPWQDRIKAMKRPKGV